MFTEPLWWSRHQEVSLPIRTLRTPYILQPWSVLGKIASLSLSLFRMVLNSEWFWIQNISSTSSQLNAKVSSMHCSSTHNWKKMASWLFQRHNRNVNKNRTNGNWNRHVEFIFSTDNPYTIRAHPVDELFLINTWRGGNYPFYILFFQTKTFWKWYYETCELLERDNGEWINCN